MPDEQKLHEIGLPCAPVQNFEEYIVKIGNEAERFERYRYYGSRWGSAIKFGWTRPAG